MRTLQTETMRVLPLFASPLSKSVWRHVQALLAGERLTLLAPMPWASRVWASPFLLLALAHSEHYARQQGRRHNKPPSAPGSCWFWPGAGIQNARDRGRRRVYFLEATRPLPEAQEEADRLLITRLRLDAAPYRPASPRKPSQRQPPLEG
jgi:hypothetical protein